MPRVKKNSYEEFNSPFATRLRGLLNAPEMNQSKLADRIGVTRQAISAYSLGISLPDIEKFEKIADFFGVSTEFLLGRTDVQKPDATKQAAAEYLCLSEVAIDEIRRLQSVVHLEQNLENDFHFTAKEPEPLAEVFSEWLAAVDLSELMSCIWRAARAAYAAQDSAHHPENYQPDANAKEAIASLRERGFVTLSPEEQLSFFCQSASKLFSQAMDAVVAQAIAEADGVSATDESSAAGGSR
jgi:transcriptional regulator with XRE-family HTH domain